MKGERRESGRGAYAGLWLLVTCYWASAPNRLAGQPAGLGPGSEGRSSGSAGKGDDARCAERRQGSRSVSRWCSHVRSRSRPGPSGESNVTAHSGEGRHPGAGQGEGRRCGFVAVASAQGLLERGDTRPVRLGTPDGGQARKASREGARRWLACAIACSCDQPRRSDPRRRCHAVRTDYADHRW